MSQNMMKQQADQHHNESSFEEGYWVFFWPQPYKEISIKKLNKDNKLAPKYYVPYKVLQNIGSMAYKLEIPSSSRVQPIYHVSYIENVIGDKILIQTILLDLV